MGMDHLYHALGIEAGASAEQLRYAYKQKILIHHPDKGGSAENFRLVRYAYATLSSVAVRRKASVQKRSSKTVRRKSSTTALIKGPLGAGVPPKKRDQGGQHPRAIL